MEEYIRRNLSRLTPEDMGLLFTVFCELLAADGSPEREEENG